MRLALDRAKVRDRWQDDPGANGRKMCELPPQVAELRMARYFISTTNHVTVMDKEGVDLTSRDALRDFLRRVLTEILQDEGSLTGVNDFSAQAYDESGKLIMSARASFSITDQ